MARGNCRLCGIAMEEPTRLARAPQAQEDLRRRERAATIDHLNALRHR
jgi:hypothetical protein